MFNHQEKMKLRTCSKSVEIKSQQTNFIPHAIQDRSQTIGGTDQVSNKQSLSSCAYKNLRHQHSDSIIDIKYSMNRNHQKSETDPIRLSNKVTTENNNHTYQSDH